MKVGIIGNGPHVEERAEAVRATEGAALAEHLPEATAAGVLQRQEAALDVVFASGAAARRVEVAEAALRQGRHVFLEWPPAASVQELERLAERAEEAGAEVGVSRPLRFHPILKAVPAGAHAEMVAVEERFEPAGSIRWTQHLTDALDLCSTLAGARAGPGAGVRRIDAQAVRSGSGMRLDALACGLRFHSGTYAQLSLRRTLRPARPVRLLYTAGAGFRLEADLRSPHVYAHAEGASGAQATGDGAPPGKGSAFYVALLRQETEAFLRALAGRRPAPVSILDGLAAMRLTERVMQQLR